MKWSHAIQLYFNPPSQHPASHPSPLPSHLISILKSESREMTDTTTYGLTPVQDNVIAAITGGATMKAAAAAVGIHRNTIGYWGKTSVAFREALSLMPSPPSTRSSPSPMSPTPPASTPPSTSSRRHPLLRHPSRRRSTRLRMLKSCTVPHKRPTSRGRIPQRKTNKRIPFIQNWLRIAGASAQCRKVLPQPTDCGVGALARKRPPVARRASIQSPVTLVLLQQAHT